MEVLEQKLLEAACIGDLETVDKLTREDININAQQKGTGWTALHWSCKKGHENITRLLLSRGADPSIANVKNETPADVCTSPSMFNSFMNDAPVANNHLYDYKIRSNILKNSTQTDPALSRIKHSNITHMPSTMLPSVALDEVMVNMKKTVLISKSKDIIKNLAFEDWMYKNYNFKNHQVLLVWRSNPCVVIGRHQNPFVEVNLSELKNISKNGVILARRNSGGGTVFHDNGNLNLSFLTTHECYNRKYNLEIISRAVSKECGLNIEINKREDLVFGDFKVSGTASKLGRPNAYHHCTLLVNANKEDLSRSLKKMDLNIKTNATKSVRTKIINLDEKKSDISMENLIKLIGIEYMQTPAFQGKNKGYVPNIPRGIKYVEPSEDQYPGLNQIQEHFSSWKWIYGKTPKFTIEYTLPLSDLNESEDCIATLTVENGIISDIKFVLPEILNCSEIVSNVEDFLKNTPFSLDVYNILKTVLCNNSKKETTSVV